MDLILFRVLVRRRTDIHGSDIVQGSGTKEDGYLAYYEICANVIDDGWNIVTQYPGMYTCSYNGVSLFGNYLS